MHRRYKAAIKNSHRFLYEKPQLSACVWCNEAGQQLSPSQAMFIPTSSVCGVCRHCPCAAVLYSVCSYIHKRSVAVRICTLWTWSRSICSQVYPLTFPSCSDLVQWENWWLEIWKDRFVLGQCVCVSQHSAWWPPHSIPRVKARSVKTINQCYLLSQICGICKNTTKYTL